MGELIYKIAMIYLHIWTIVFGVQMIFTIPMVYYDVKILWGTDDPIEHDLITDACQVMCGPLINPIKKLKFIWFLRCRLKEIKEDRNE